MAHLDRLLVQVLTAIGDTRVSERWITGDADEIVSACVEGQTVTVNPAIDTVDSLIHETLHMIRPRWPEAYVKGRTKALMRAMTNQQIQEVYAAYEARCTRRKTPKVL